MAFNGFEKGFDDFLFSLKFNNSQGALSENKAQYLRLVKEPLIALYEELMLSALAVDPGIDTKRVRCVSPTYNDMRFSRETPLREYAFIRFRTPDKEENQLALYFDIYSEGFSYGLYIYRQTTAGLAALRAYALAHQKEFIKELRSLAKLGIAADGERYARDHYPEVDEPLKGMLNVKRYLNFIRRYPLGQEVYTPELAKEIGQTYEALAGLYRLIAAGLYGER